VPTIEPKRWSQIEELYHSAREGGREVLAHVAPDLRLEVERLLAQDADAGVLDRPVVQLFGAAAARLFAPGVQLGPYRIEEHLGTGGMGEVFRATDTRLGRAVAVKTNQAQFSERFYREARAISSLNHPHICTLYDVGPDYLVMELIAGKTLAAHLKRGPLSIEQSIRFGSQIADALAAAHRKGIVHRDLKPSNIMLTKSGVKILDFGVAKSAHDESHTMTRVIMGTPAYMAPEQSEGKECDHRTDIYALGLVLRQMATGQQEATTRNLPPHLAHLIERCLETEPEERWQAASDVAKELEWAAASAAKSKGAFGVSPKRRTIIPWAVAGLVCCLALLVLARTSWRSNSEQALSYRQLTFHRGSIGAARFAPGGETIIYDASWGGKANDIFESQLESPEARELGLPNSYLASITNSGELIILQRHRPVSTRVWYDPATLARVPLAGGTPREILEDAYAADSSAGGSDLAVMQLRGATLNVQYPLGVTACQVPLSDKPTFRIAPDGKTLAVTRHAQGQDRVSLFRKGSQNEDTVAEGYQVSSLAWLSGRELLFSGYKPNGNGFGLFATSDTGSPRVLARFPYDFQIQDVWNGERYLLKAQHDRSIAMFRVGNGNERNLSWLDHTHVNGLTADGSALLISEIGQGGRRPGSVYLRKTDGAPATKLGAGVGFALSPDGKWALMQPAEKSELTLVPTAAGLTYTFQLPRGASLQSARWFPDGSHIALNLQTEQGLGCYLQDLQGAQPRGSPHQIPNVGMPCFAVSPDSQYVAAMSGGAPPRIFRVADGAMVPLFGVGPGERPLSFSADGRFLYVARFQESPTGATLFRIEIRTGRRQLRAEIVPADASGVPRIDFIFITPDGQQFAYSFHRLLNELFLAETR
jgi:predicted Ser/Thr protein kinase